MELAVEQQLIREAKDDLKAFAKLYDHYFGKIYGYCLNRIGHKEKAEDITSQTFLKSISIVKSFNFKKSPRLGPWLYAIAHNLMIDMLRREAKLQPLEKMETEGENGSETFEKKLQIDLIQKQILEVLNEINPRYAQLISLKFYSELDASEIALTMGLKSSQVPVLLFRAMASFRETYQKKFPESEIYYSN